MLKIPTAVDIVHNGVSDAEASTFASVATSQGALGSGRVDATAINLSTEQSPAKYKVGFDSWQPLAYAFAVKPDNQRWLNRVNTALLPSSSERGTAGRNLT